MTKKIILTSVISLWTCIAFSQETTKKYWVSGNARNVFNLDEIHTDDDSLAASKAEYGHTLIDLSANIKPNENTFIKTTLRVRNEYGGFWGSGITFDIRELYMKGLIANSIRYQLGDFQYKLTPFTFYNNDEEFYENSLDIFNIYSNHMHYDFFYYDNTWRQQGAAVDFALSFRKGLEEVQFNLFSSRLNPSNFSTVSDRIFYGANMTLVQSSNISAGFNYVNVKDLEGTSNATTFLRNPVYSATYDVDYSFNDLELNIQGESGMSESFIENDEYSPVNEDYFHYAKASLNHTQMNMTFDMAYRHVGPYFRSAAAQTRRLSYKSQSEQYSRYTNDQIVRPLGLWDIYNDASLYNTTIETGLSDFYPQYNNIDPYGLATPNRKGFEFSLERLDEEERYEVMLKYGMLTDVVGYGIETLKKYNSLEAHVKLQVDAFIPFMNLPLTTELGYYNNSTQRSSSDKEFADVDLKTNRFNVGLTLDLNSEFSLIGGYETYSASGNDWYAQRNTYDEIIQFNEFTTDLKESIKAYGIQYSFNELNELKLIYQDYSWENSVEILPEYSFDRLSLVFNMKF